MFAGLVFLATCAPTEIKTGLGPVETTPVEIGVVADTWAIIVGEAVEAPATALNANGQVTPAAIDRSASGDAFVTLSDSSF